ncbi:MAG: cell division protein FtsX [Gemmatimonadales bacterium]|nr:ABC transporter permease [Gemmatimonadota bacterium]MCB9505960.1 ABC transporter permease [Gemmatimonadales bacterium]MCB9519051.1 ABC transporter permease [Gemmatimonadales bacterium]
MKLVWREALLSFSRTRTLSVLSVTTIAFALFVTGLFGLVALNLRGAINRIEERVEIVAFVLRGTPSQGLAVAMEDIAAFPEVLSVRYVTEEDALAQAKQDLVEFRDAYEDLQINPLPPSIELRLRPGFRDAAHVGEVAERLRGFPFVEDVRYGRDWVERLDALRTLAGLVGGAIGLAFALVSVVIIGVTIRITVLQRAREISIMRLVGATDWFIRGPFLLEGALKGLLGGVLAYLLCLAVYAGFKAQGLGLGIGLEFFRPIHSLAFLAFGTLLGLAGSLVSVGRHLRKV